MIDDRFQHLQHGNANNGNGNGNDSGGNFLRPIAFKPIPFEPDYRIAAQQQQQQQQQLHLHQQQQQLHQQQQQAASALMVPTQQQLAGERYGYGSTPSLVPLSSSATQKFGSKSGPGTFPIFRLTIFPLHGRYNGFAPSGGA